VSRAPTCTREAPPAAASEPQRAEFLKDDLIGGGGKVAAIGQRPRRLVLERLPRQLPHGADEPEVQEQEQAQPRDPIGIPEITRLPVPGLFFPPKLSTAI